MFNKILVSILFLFTIQGEISAQQFDYVFSQRIEPYENLEQSIPLSELFPWYGEAWNFPIGFNFKFFDYNFDSVLVYCASSLYFGNIDQEESLVFAGFSQAITDRAWANQSYSLSPISYSLSGDSPDQICKIEFRNAGFDLAPVEDSVYIQIWLYESDHSIEVHLGSHFITSAASYWTVEAKGPIIGFINELDQKIAILNGNTASPEFGVPTDSIAGLEGDWADGQVYRFAPYSSPTKELLDESKISISPNPCSDLLQIHSKNEINGLKADIFDIFGRLVLTQTIHDNAQINVSSLPPGAYFIQINGHKQFHKQAFSKI